MKKAILVILCGAPMPQGTMPIKPFEINLPPLCFYQLPFYKSYDLFDCDQDFYFEELLDPEIYDDIHDTF